MKTLYDWLYNKSAPDIQTFHKPPIEDRIGFCKQNWKYEKEYNIYNKWKYLFKNQTFCVVSNALELTANYKEIQIANTFSNNRFNIFMGPEGNVHGVKRR